MFTRSSFQTPDMIGQHMLLNDVADLIDKGVLRTTLDQTFGTINAANLKRAHALSGKRQVARQDRAGGVVERHVGWAKAPLRRAHHRRLPLNGGRASAFALRATADSCSAHPTV